MAINDVREYYYTMLNQYLEEKQNLADFEEALKDGFITEEQMRDALDTVAALEANYHRITYIMYLLEIPKRKSKKAWHKNQYSAIVEEFHRLGVDLESISNENSDALRHFKTVLKDLKNKSKH